MNVKWLTQVKENPPVWTQAWKYCAPHAVLRMTLIVVVIPLPTGKVIGEDQKIGDINEATKPFDNCFLTSCFTDAKYFIMNGLYVGVHCIIFGTGTLTPPAGSWTGNMFLPASPAEGYTMVHSCKYLLVHAAVQFSWTASSVLSMPWVH